MLGLRATQILQRILGAHEVDAEALLAEALLAEALLAEALLVGAQAEGHGEMRLADAGRPQQHGGAEA
jgi:hypothetical protein